MNSIITSEKVDSLIDQLQASLNEYEKHKEERS